MRSEMDCETVIKNKRISFQDALKKTALLFLYLISRKFFKKESSLIVITYHRITEDDTLFDPLIVSPKIFERQIDFLKKEYQIISGNEFKTIINSGKKISGNKCLITFDDGWRDNYDNAFPILRKYAVPAIVFISTDFVDTNMKFWTEIVREILSSFRFDHFKSIENSDLGLPEYIQELFGQTIKSKNALNSREIQRVIIEMKSLNQEKIKEIVERLKYFRKYEDKAERRVMLSWNEIEKMSQENIMFGSHTKSHTILTKVNDIEAISELVDSKKIIEEKIKKKVYFLSYPNGDFNDNVIKNTRKSSYLGAFSCISGFNNSNFNEFKIKRIHIRADRSLGLNQKFSGIFFKILLSGTRDIFRIKKTPDKY
jgi:peptidoglycan/xylan/chitin deacetylase (PgdA/CDA1 family)